MRTGREVDTRKGHVGGQRDGLRRDFPERRNPWGLWKFAHEL
jgi:hypothetical protein